MTTLPGLPDYRRLLASYATGLLGTGVAVVGVALLAFELAGDNAGLVISAALSIKAFSYVLIAPLAAALSGRLPKKRLLVALDLAQAAAILSLPFATELWRLYLAVFVCTACAAAFTPTYQALTPHLLPDPDDYARALAKSRIVNDVETAISPLVAGALLLVVDFRGLFLAAMALFLFSAAWILPARLPDPPAGPGRGVLRQMALGPRLLFATPGLRGLAPLHLAAAAAAAMVLVNTVVIVQGDFGLDARASAVALAVYGFGSVLGALATPGLLARAGERPTIFAGCAVMVAGLFAGAAIGGYPALLALWAAIGAGTALALTPAPFVLRRHARPEQRGVLYAALFALANATLLVAFPVAGWLGAAFPPAVAFVALGVLAGASSVAVALAWPRGATAPAG